MIAESIPIIEVFQDRRFYVVVQERDIACVATASANELQTFFNVLASGAKVITDAASSVFYEKMTVK